jgi:anti-anti-sigma factor
MNVSSSRIDDVLQLGFDGGDALDVHSVGLLKERALTLLDARSDVVIDLSGVEFIDSAGLSLLVSLYKATRLNGRRVNFTGVHGGVLRTIEVIQLNRIFDLYDDLESAVRALHENALRTGQPAPSAQMEVTDTQVQEGEDEGENQG